MLGARKDGDADDHEPKPEIRNSCADPERQYLTKELAAKAAEVARIQAEQGMLQTDSTKLNVLYQAAQAQELARRQSAIEQCERLHRVVRVHRHARPRDELERVGRRVAPAIVEEAGQPQPVETPFCTAAIRPPIRVRLRFESCVSVDVVASAYFSRIGANGVSGWPVT